MRVTKAMILAGNKYRHTVEVDGIGEFVIRPLTQLEYECIQEISLDGIDAETIGKLGKMAKGGDVELAPEAIKQAQRNEAKGNRMAVSIGLSCDGEQWSEEDVKQLPSNVFEELKNAVFAISGIGSEGAALAAKFLADK